MKDRQWPIFGLALLLVFLIALGVLLLVRDTVRETVIIPILYLAWLGNLIFRSINQVLFWVVFFLVAAILLLASLRRDSQPEQVLARRPSRVQESGRVSAWATLVARTAAESRHDLITLREFRKLIVAVWAYHANRSPAEIESDIRSGALEPPPEYRFYFQTSRRSEGASGGLLRRALQRLRSALRMAESQPAPASDPHLRLLIQSLENEWEVDRDR